MNTNYIKQACYNLGLDEPISIEPDGIVWLGVDADRTYPDMEPIKAEAARLEAQKIDYKNSGRQKLAALGLTDAEIDALLRF